MLTFAHQEHIQTYYSDTRNIHLKQPSLTQKISADVCIIGSGFLGLSTAIELAEKGKKVVVLEGARIGFGASGRNGGQAINGFEEGIDEYIEQVGFDKAKQLWDMSVEAINIIDERVKKYNIQCDWRKGYATLALNQRRLADLIAIEKASRQHFGYSQMELWDKAKLKQHLGSDIYCGALYDAQSGHLHPLNYCLGLAQAALNLGVEIYEHSPALDIHSSSTVKIETPQGIVTANNVVLAMNAYIDEKSNKKFGRKLARKILPVESFIITTEPLEQSVADSLINNGMSVCDNNILLDYYRLTADNRLLFGSDSSNNVDMVKKMRKNMLAVFPQLENVKIDYGWGGPIDMTLNASPHFGRIQPNIYFAQGFSGHGVALTGLAGRIIAEAIEGNDQRLSVFEQLKVPTIFGGKWVKRMALNIGIPYYRFLDKYR
ncbi:FAD-binding oxidoreductase [Ursidibacter maritimus]|uniref:FAD-binding oxidoreductase n=1 Tax=Ursidibacter maritimus TaxID=1331689 RepID=A0A949T3T5_9PAST|nr:FAD-binding oxidoreductase [Ursidibacter maritimus]KAE9541921.1 oxidoreductase [Ursidibacter maritimus]MBV6523279.1 FAD-binding oxidoreductase [Ursidibacter maritimus]MBV6525735.1 FAD-binding oxidoreductase [Ursidibacter maritimus]MBV6527369.1 FAD-binding oxidoreductase [Ursidibacter maritimus]MBV6529394.1 FAD-binding oxidoreductase [Ursidibacter maritimus]